MPLVREGLLESWATLEGKERMVPWGLQVLLGHPDYKDFQVLLVKRARKGTVEDPDFVDRKDLPVKKVLRELKEEWDCQDQWVLMDCKGRKESQDHLDHQEILEKTVNMEVREHQVPKEKKESLDYKGPQEKGGLLDRLVRKEMLDPLDSRVLQASQGSKG